MSYLGIGVAAVVGGLFLAYTIKKWVEQGFAAKENADTLATESRADAQATIDEESRRSAREQAKANDKGFDTW